MSKNKANIWGTHAVKAAWQNTERNIHAAFVTENSAREFAAFQAVKGAKRPAPALISKKELDKMTGNAVHQGMALISDPLSEIFLSDIIVKAEQKERSLVVILDQVTDPHNVGAILRSACAFSADAILLQRKHAPDMEGVLAKTACGAVEYVPVIEETNLSRAIEKLQGAGFMVIGLDERGKQTVSEVKDHQKIALVLGAEGPGIRPNVANHCDILARLEMHGPMPSINVSNAAAVALYALTSS